MTQAETAVMEQAEGRLLLFDFGGPVSFGIAKTLLRRLGAADSHDALVLDFSAVPLIDSSASLALEDIVLQALDGGKAVFLAGLAPRVHRTLDRIGMLAKLPDDCRKPDRLAALEAALARLG